MHYLTAGESHVKQLTTIIEGMPARMPLTGDDINHSLLRRQKGYGRGKRMEIEKDLGDNQFPKLKKTIADYRNETRWFQ